MTRLAALCLANTEIIIESLEDLKGIIRQLISFLQESRPRRDSYYQWGLCGRVDNRVKPNNIDEMLRGYYLGVRLFLNMTQRCCQQAFCMRQNVND